MKRAFIFAFFLLSCTHWLIDTETRIQVKNSTSDTIKDLCIVSKSKEQRVLVPNSIASGEKSNVHEVEWVGEFDFMVYVHVGDNWEPQPLGIHKLKGGSVLAEISEENGKYEMTLK
jgi:hypothetical protein